jgi:hypothetical protein
MKNEFVTYEHALKLKKLGFDEPSIGYYTVSVEDNFDYFSIPEHNILNGKVCNPPKNYNTKFYEEEGTISTPLKQQVFNWFREKGYYGEIFVDDDKTFGYYITNFVPLGRVSHPLKRGYLTYEEAEGECIEKLIELIENGTEEDL